MKWEEESYTRRDEHGNLVTLEEYQQRAHKTGWRAWVSSNDLKLYAICGVGFFMDSYDLFIINLVQPNLIYEYWGGIPGGTIVYPPKPYEPALLRGCVNAAANIGNIFGQLSFGLLGDTFGRKFVYGKEMIIAIIGIILTISLPNSLPGNSFNKMWWLFGFRLLMGIGIGGDYPMSAAIVAERSTLQNRGRMLGWIFSNQGWGTLTASVVTLVLYGCFSSALQRGEYGQVDAIWRLQIGLALVPAFATLWQRLTMPNSRKFEQSQELSSVAAKSMSSQSTLDTLEAPKEDLSEKMPAVSAEKERKISVVEANAVKPSKAVNLRAAMVYFSEWRHLKTLIGTASTWFLVDIAFYGINLNQSQILTDIGFSKGSNQYHTFVLGAAGNLIIAAAGYVPGYFITIATIEILGRKWIQIQGFIVTAICFLIIAAAYTPLGTAGRFVFFVFAQLFFNFGANATTFIIPAEVYPSRIRGFAHGFSAAVGKLGAILAGLLFNYLSGSHVWGLQNVLYVFFGLNILGAIMTFFFVPETKGKDADAIDWEECQEAIRIREGQNGS